MTEATNALSKLGAFKKALNNSQYSYSGVERLLRLNEAANILGVSTQTLRNWDCFGKLKTVRTTGNQRRVPVSEVNRLLGELEQRSVKLYARVSTHMQKNDLERQVRRLKQSYPGAELFFDIRSGLKFDRRGFLQLLDAVQQRRVSKVIVVCEDRLARFGVDLIRRLLASYGTELEVLDPVESATSGQELARDLMAIITSFSARLYGLRSHKTKKLLSATREVLRDP